MLLAQFLLPVMISVLSAKFVGGLFTDSLYTEHLKLDKKNFIFGDDCPPKLKTLRACDIMSAGW